MNVYLVSKLICIFLGIVSVGQTVIIFLWNSPSTKSILAKTGLFSGVFQFNKVLNILLREASFSVKQRIMFASSSVFINLILAFFTYSIFTQIHSLLQEPFTDKKAYIKKIISIMFLNIRSLLLLLIIIFHQTLAFYLLKQNYPFLTWTSLLKEIAFNLILLSTGILIKLFFVALKFFN